MMSFVDEAGCYQSLTPQEVIADVAGNKATNFLMVNREIKSCIGPCHALRLVVTDNDSYKFFVYDSVIEDFVVTVPFEISCVIATLNKLTACSWIWYERLFSP